jgi:hypothetical protein
MITGRLKYIDEKSILTSLEPWISTWFYQQKKVESLSSIERAEVMVVWCRF